MGAVSKQNEIAPIYYKRKWVPKGPFIVRIFVMKHILNLQSDYSKNGGYIQLLLPIHTETLIPVDDSVRLIDQVLEEIDYRELYLWDIPF